MRATADATAIVAAILTSSAAFSATITNPSFELDTFTNAPGSIGSNTLITGWTATDPEQVGLNPVGTNYPYADNGAVPDGTNVAYIATHNVSLSTEMTGLTTGETYKVRFRVNSPAGQKPTLRILLDGERLVNTHVLPVDGTNPYRAVAADFTATATNQTLTVTNVSAAAGLAVLLDDFTIDVSPGTWSYAIWTNDASMGIVSNRTYTHACSFGSTNSTTINGVYFRGVNGGNPSDPGRFATSGYHGQVNNDPNVIVDSGGDSAVLARQFVYAGNVQTLTLYGLAPGAEYVASLYSVAWETGARTLTFGTGSEQLSINQDEYGNNIGIRMSYRYTAPANGSIAIPAARIGEGTLHLYGFSNREEAQAPVIHLQPHNQIIAAGNTSYLRTLAAGVLPLAYQWEKDGAPLAGETSDVLTLAVTGAAETGDYVVVVTNTYGAVTSDVATLTLGMIANPSFEADTPVTYPGYAGNPGNVPISGWAGSDSMRVGINPVLDGRGLFADNGAIPNGDRVAFVQGTATQGIGTVVSGLTPGETYTVNLRANRRNSGGVPALRASVDGERVLDAEFSSVGGTNPYRYVAFDFTAGAESQVLAFTNDAAGDTTVLLDDVTIAPSTTGWSYAAWTNDASSGISSTGTYTHAYNFGSWASPTINGVLFTGIADYNPSRPGKFSTSGMTQRVNNDANVLTGGGGGSAGLARDFIYWYNGTLHTIAIDGLVPGTTYEATVYGVGWDNWPTLRVATFGVGEDRMTVNEDAYGNNAGIRISYRYVADASGSVTLSYVPLKLPTSFHTYGFGNREVASPHPPVFYTQPAAKQSVHAGATVAFSAQTGGMQPLFHQWRRDGHALAGATNRTLSLVDVALRDAGVYTLFVSNAVGQAVSSNAALEVGLAIATLFNTGVDGNGVLLTDGAVDPHYTLVTSDDPAWPGPAAYAATAIPGAFVPSGPDSLWISPRTNLLGGCADGTYTYRLAFSMVGYDPGSARIGGEWAVDNDGVEIVFNGVNLGIVNTTGFGVYAPFTIGDGFVEGENSLDFVTQNQGAGPTGLRVRLSGTAHPSNKGMVLMVR